MTVILRENQSIYKKHEDTTRIVDRNSFLLYPDSGVHCTLLPAGGREHERVSYCIFIHTHVPALYWATMHVCGGGGDMLIIIINIYSLYMKTCARAT